MQTQKKRLRYSQTFFPWRRRRDSNPRYHDSTPVFKTGAFDHSATSPLQMYTFFVTCNTYDKNFCKNFYYSLKILIINHITTK